MDDTRYERTPLSTDPWLRFSVAFADSTRLLRLLRRSCPDPAPIAHGIRQYLHGRDSDLAERLQVVGEDIALDALISPTTVSLCDKAVRWQAAATNHHLVGLDHPAYPESLLRTDNAPPLLYARGCLQALDHPLLAVVGSRKASHIAITHTRKICEALADMGIGIVSGLALGIDAAAHEAALEARRKNPQAAPTVALAATPADRVYPVRHADLAERIVADGGLILTEYRLGSTTRPWHFPRRNRLISGISLGVLVAEAGLPSGTLTTADHALDQGREVMAMPGSLGNPQARGCHMLIKNGAALVESARDVADVLAPSLASVHAQLNAQSRADSGLSPRFDQAPADLSAEQQALLTTLGAGAASVDELVTYTGLAVSQLAAALGTLETRGLITTTAGGRYARC